MIQVILLAIMVSLVADSQVEKPNLDNLLERNYPALTLERFLQIVHNADDVADLKATQCSVASTVTRERFEKARAKIEEIRQNKNLTFDVDFMPFNAWSDEQQELLHGFVPLTNSDIHDLTGLPIRTAHPARRYTYAPINYLDLEMVTSVKDQGPCSTSYAFAAAGQLESALLLASMMGRNLSVQHLILCTYRNYKFRGGLFNFGCAGGHPAVVIDYYNHSDILSAQQLPYNTRELGYPNCTIPNRVQSRRVNFTFVQPRDEDYLGFLLEQNGPISIVIHSRSPSFYHYSGGVFNDHAACNHAPDLVVLLVGLIVRNGEELWIIKNSWGKRWGNKGYMLLPKGENMCNILVSPVMIVKMGDRTVFR